MNKKPRNMMLEILQAIWYVIWIIGAMYFFARVYEGCEQQQEDEVLGRSIRTGQPLSYPEAEDNYDRPGD